ncbi:MAG: 2-oxoacid:acceptor oxidoreductase family protein, partial [Maribacter sp.]
GTANVTVIMSDERISSPYLKMFDTAIILNQQSMDKFEKSVKPDGMLLYDPNGISQHPTRKDIKIYRIEGAKLAAEMGNKKIFNMVVLGAFLKIKPIVKFENVIEGLKKSLSERYHHLIPLNKEALIKGMDSVSQYNIEEQIFHN